VDYDGSKDSLAGIEETIYSAAYQARSVPRPRVLVIGVGGGFDILTALAFDASEVTGIDVNRATLGIVTRTYADYFRAWVQDPRVRLVADEGRHHLTSTSGRFDVLQLSGVDSYSGTPGAANVFSESYLYTLEASASTSST
jgi:spermidine synthase